MIKAIFFGLDNCLAAANEPGEELLAPVFRAIRDANGSTLTQFQLAAAFSDCWVHAFDFVAKKHKFSRAMYDAGYLALSRVEVSGTMKGYGDLHVLDELAEDLFLVTSGFERLQLSKVRALSLEAKFSRIVVDAVDDPKRTSKQVIFAQLMKERGYLAQEVLVVGDNPDSELGAAVRLGAVSVQTLRPGVRRWPDALHHIARLTELPPLVAQL